MAFGYKVYKPEEDAEYQRYNTMAEEAVKNGIPTSQKTQSAHDAFYNKLNNFQFGEKYNQYASQLEGLREYKDPNGYGQKVKDYTQMYEDYRNKPFSYDVNADALYQQYKQQYMQQGKLAMKDTMGQAAALTGGYGNSYAATAGNQAYQQYLGRLNDVVPQLYQMAYDRYRDKGQDIQTGLNMYNSLNQQDIAAQDKMYDRVYALMQDAGNMDYNMWAKQLDALENEWTQSMGMDTAQWQALVDRATTMATNARNWNSQAVDTQNEWEYRNYQEALAAAQAAASGSGGSGRTRSGGGGNNNGGGDVKGASLEDYVAAGKQMDNPAYFVQQLIADGTIDRAAGPYVMGRINGTQKEIPSMTENFNKKKG